MQQIGLLSVLSWPGSATSAALVALGTTPGWRPDSTPGATRRIPTEGPIWVSGILTQQPARTKAAWQYLLGDRSVVRLGPTVRSNLGEAQRDETRRQTR